MVRFWIYFEERASSFAKGLNVWEIEDSKKTIILDPDN